MREDDLRSLHTDARECADSFHRGRNMSLMFCDEFFCCHEEMFRFDSIIVHTPEHHFYFLRFELEQVCRSFHEFEESLCRFIHSLIRHLCGEHDSCEELKWRLKIQLNQFGGIELEYGLEYFIPLGFCTDFHEIHGREVGWKCKERLFINFFRENHCKKSVCLL